MAEAKKIIALTAPSGAGKTTIARRVLATFPEMTFSVSATDDLDPAPIVVCTPPSGSFFARGTTPVTCTATDASGNQATCHFHVIVHVKPVLPK